MKKTIFILILFGTSITLFGQGDPFATVSIVVNPISPCLTSGYILKFEDNFKGNSLDTNKWELQTSHQGNLDIDCGSGNPNNVQGLYTLDNVEVSNGTLKIIAKNQPVMGKTVSWKSKGEILCDNRPNFRLYNYTSSAIWTKTKFKALGKYEIKCRMPKGKEFFPAFWAFSGNSIAGGTRWNEIDIFDNTDGIGLDKPYYYGVLYDYDNDGHPEEYRAHTKNIPDLSQWHIFTCVYEIDKVSWYIDGLLIKTEYRKFTLGGNAIACGEGSGGLVYLRHKSFPIDDMQIILDLAINAGKNAPTSSTTFPSTLEVDYVKYWEGPQPPTVPCLRNIIRFSPFAGHHQGDNALLALNATVKTGTNAEVVARNGIDIWHNFEVELGATFTARIDPTVCGSYNRIGNTNNKNTNSDKEFIKNGFEIRNNSISIYPNPNTGKFTIEMANVRANSLVEIYDIMGKKIWNTNKVNNKLTIDIANQPKGIYLVKVLNGNKVSMQKIVYQ